MDMNIVKMCEPEEDQYIKIDDFLDAWYAL